MRTLTTLWRGGLGLLALATVAVCFAYRQPSLDAVSFFSYWTILSNLAGGAVLLAGTVPAWRGERWLDWARGAAALYLVITGLVYWLLMGGVVGSWSGWVQHRIMPVAMPLDWLLFTPVRRLPTWRTLLGWLAFPLGYLGYVLAHGSLTRWYPYPFLNAGRYGYEVVVGYSVGIAAVFVAVAALLLGWADLRRRAARVVQPAGELSWVRDTP